jgi:mersacidin/lichenicidin family type 2 lantibiotic
MSVNIVRAWSDPEYRNSLTVGQLASVPANPVSAGELSDEELVRISGGGAPPMPTCWYYGLVYTFARE